MSWRLEWHDRYGIREGHVLPSGEEHEISLACPCEPRIENDENGRLVIHMAFDGRHALEQAREILNSSSNNPSKEVK
jgi:hypothetical protein